MKAEVDKEEDKVTLAKIAWFLINKHHVRVVFRFSTDCPVLEFNLTNLAGENKVALTVTAGPQHHFYLVALESQR